MRKRPRGFTVVEMMVVLSVAAIFAAVAYPSFMTTIRDTSLITTADMLTADLVIARREAIKQNGRVLVCPAGNDGACGTDFTKWANGWLVCYALGSSTACDGGTADKPNPILLRGKLSASLALNGPTAAVTFIANGQASAGALFCVKGTWTGSSSYLSTIAPSGNIKLEKGSSSCS